MSRKNSTQRSDCVPAGSSDSHRCHVYFCTRPIQACLSGLRKPPEVSPRSGLTCFRHWLVALEYEEEVIVCEADNAAGELKGKWHARNREEFHKDFPKKEYLGQYNIAKQAVKEIVEAMIECGRYNPFSNNCQKWLKQVLKRLDMDTSNLGTEAKTAAWAIVGGLLLTGVVGAVGYGAHKHFTKKESKK